MAPKAKDRRQKESYRLYYSVHRLGLGFTVVSSIIWDRLSMSQFSVTTIDCGSSVFTIYPPSAEWDSTEGVWVGEKAPSTHTISELPRPLYVFGYGSLIWRPGPLLENCKSFQCSAIGYRRMFAQRSCDHRGTASFPGVVLNLVRDEYLSSNGYHITSPHHNHESDLSSSSRGCRGLIWLIPESVITEVIDDLDYRERGGYHRHLINVRLHEDTPFHLEGDIIQAIVYTAHESNPLFFLPSYSDHPSLEKNLDGFHLQKRSAVVDLIASSIGPSGPNLEYLFRLQQYLVERGMGDEYINDLAKAVRMRTGIWRAQKFRCDHPQMEPERLKQFQTTSSDRNSLRLFGWGSNEYCQLFPLKVSNNGINNGDDVEPFAKLLTTHSRIMNNESQFVLSWQNLENIHILAGGSSSAVVYLKSFQNGSKRSCIYIWGDLLVNEIMKYTGHERHSSDAFHACAIIIEGVTGAAIGHDHIILMVEGNQKLICLGNNSHKQCNAPASVSVDPDNCYLQFKAIELREQEDIQVLVYEIIDNSEKDKSQIVGYTLLKIAAGLYHSAAITVCGKLITWGDKKYGQCLADDVYWCPPHDRKLIDVCCGAKHTHVIDDHGVVYSMGSNRYGSLGREIYFEIDEALSHTKTLGSQKSNRKGFDIDGTMRTVLIPTDIKFQKISAGWYHCIARGVKADGEVVFFGWGRNDMKQYITKYTDNKAGEQKISPCQVPTLLRCLPENRFITDAWCGSEFTLVLDDKSNLWGCGWNEHGNLGIGMDSVCGEWKQVLTGDDGQRSPITLQLWEGNLACGGGHVIALVK